MENNMGDASMGFCIIELVFLFMVLIRIIMSFDVKSENFNIIKFPEGRSHKLHMIPYQGRLALVTHTYDVVKIYILKNARGYEWTRESVVLQLPCENVRRDCIRFMGSSEFIFAPSGFSEAFYILYIDPRRNSTREAFFEGY